MIYTREEYENIARLLMSTDNSSVLLGLEMIAQTKDLDIEESKLIYPLAILYKFNRETTIKEKLKESFSDFRNKYQSYLDVFGVFIFVNSCDINRKSAVLKRWEIFLAKVELYIPYWRMNLHYIDELGALGYRVDKYFKLHEISEVALDMCLKYDPTNGERHFDMGYMINTSPFAKQSLKKRKALKHYKLAIKNNYYPYLAYHNLGTTYRDLFGDKEKAEAAFRKSLENRPNYTSSMLNLASLISDRDWTEAKGLYEKIIKIDPKYALAYNNLAFRLWKGEQNFDKAEEYALKAIELERNACHLVTLAEVYWYGKRKPIDEIIPLLEEAATIEKNYYHALILIAEIYITEKRNLDVAEKKLNIILKEKPRNSFALKLKAQLTK